MPRTIQPLHGAHRSEITWADGAIANEWIQVTVKADANTGLLAPDVFYFGNKVGDANGDGKVDSADEAIIEADEGFLSSVGENDDFNKDNAIDTTDLSICQSNENSTPLPLITAPQPPQQRDYFTAAYYDRADRLTDSADFGTNGGAIWTRPGSVPTGSNTVLVSHTDYDSAGRVKDTIDPRGIETGYLYDMLGRTSEAIGAWDGSANPTPGSSANQITEYLYDANGDVLSMFAYQASGSSIPYEQTNYVYGVGGTIGVNLFSNDLLAKVEYPIKVTTNGLYAGQADTANSFDWQQYTFGLQGDKTGYTDQNGTTHAYGYDALGRLTSDFVTAFGTGIDQNIIAFAYYFNDAGLPSEQDSIAENGSPDNLYVANGDIETYNGLGQLVSYAQPSGTVGYSYSTATDGNGMLVGGSRLTSMTYPDGRVIDYLYGGVSAISEITYANGTATVTTNTPTGYSVGSTFTIQGVSDSALDGQFTVTAIVSPTQFEFSPSGTPGGSDYQDSDMVAVGIGSGATLDGAISRLTGIQDHYDGTTLAAYQYLGLSTIVQEDRPQPGVDLTYIQQPNDSHASTDGGDRYTGLDRFGRVIDQYWTSLDSSRFATTPDRIQYTYDADGNVLSQDNLANGFSQTYTYDNLNRLSGYSGSGGGATYSMDALGNLLTYRGTTRTFDGQNEIASGISDFFGNTIQYDAAGEVDKYVPSASSPDTWMIYDAWGRVVRIGGVSYSNIWEWLYYDANGNRTSINNVTGGISYNTTYSPSGQDLEDDTSQNGSSGTDTYVWGSLGTADLVSEDKTSQHTSGHFYLDHDANFDVTSVLWNNGPQRATFTYDPYGTLLSASAASQDDENILWQGGQYDYVTQTYRFGARVYIPQLGVWNRQDPAGYIDGGNRYAAMGDSPVSKTDPRGLSVSWWYVAKVAFGGEGAGAAGKVWGGFGSGAAHGVANVGRGVANTATQVAYQAADAANDVADIAGLPHYHGCLSDLGNASMHSNFDMTSYYASTGANIASFGVYGEIQTLSQLANGEISMDQASQQLGTMGLMQLGQAAAMSYFEPTPTDGTVFSGHGEYNAVDGYTTVPDGTSVTMFSKWGGVITDELGNAIENGEVPSGTFMDTAGPGDTIPNYTLDEPGGLNIDYSCNPITVTSPTTLDSLLQPGMGDTYWAACTYDPSSPIAGTEWGLPPRWLQYAIPYGLANPGLFGNPNLNPMDFVKLDKPC